MQPIALGFFQIDPVKSLQRFIEFLLMRQDQSGSLNGTVFVGTTYRSFRFKILPISFEGSFFIIQKSLPVAADTGQQSRPDPWVSGVSQRGLKIGFRFLSLFRKDVGPPPGEGTCSPLPERLLLEIFVGKLGAQFGPLPLRQEIFHGSCFRDRIDRDLFRKIVRLFEIVE